MKSKKVIALLLTGMMLIPTAVYAKDNGKGKGDSGKTNPPIAASHDNKGNGNGNGQGNGNGNGNGQGQGQGNGQGQGQGQGQQNKDAQKAFKDELKAKHEIMKTNTQKSIVVRQQIEAKTEELDQILQDITAGKKTLPQDLLDKLTELAQVIQTDKDQLENLNNMDTEVKDTQSNIKGGKFQAALDALDKVIAKQEARYQILVKLSSDLDAILEIARQAQPPVQTPAASGTDTTGTQTSTTGTSGATGTQNTGDVSSTTSTAN